MGANALAIIKNNYEARQTKLAELRSIDEKAVDDKGEARAYSEEEQGQINELRSELEAIDGRIKAAVDQEIRSTEITDAMGSLVGLLADKDSGDTVDLRSMGERFAAEAALDQRGVGGVYDQDVEFRAVTDITTGATSGGAFVNNQRLDRVGRTFLDRKTFLLDLLPTIQVSTGSVEYVQDTSPLADLADKAAETTEGSAKPQAGPTLAVVTEAAAVIAAWVNMTRQSVADAPQLRGYIDGRLRYSLKRRSDGQAINGNGTAPNLRGLLNRSGILTYAPAGAEARAISIRHGIRLMEDSETVPEIIVLNPADAELFDLTNSAAAGIHATPDQTGGFRQGPSRTAWGLTQVHSTAIAAGTAMLVDPMATAVLDRQSVSAYLTDSHASNFVANILTLLLEVRLGLALFDPKGVLAITFNGTA